MFFFCTYSSILGVNHIGVGVCACVRVRVRVCVFLELSINGLAMC